MLVFLYCSDIKLHLINSRHNNSGTVEISYKGKWGRVCWDSLGLLQRENVANLLCRELGFPLGVLAIFNGKIQEDSPHSSIVGVKCGGFESSISQCLFMSWRWPNRYSCSRYHAFNVICKTGNSSFDGKQLKTFVTSILKQCRNELYIFF